MKKLKAITPTVVVANPTTQPHDGQQVDDDDLSLGDVESDIEDEEVFDGNDDKDFGDNHDTEVEAQGPEYDGDDVSVLSHSDYMVALHAMGGTGTVPCSE